jgi:hypothetical protein
MLPGKDLLGLIANKNNFAVCRIKIQVLAFVNGSL